MQPQPPNPTSNKPADLLLLRVRYSETDQMGTFYNSRALEWFECGRSEWMRNRLGLPYADIEARGVFLPLVEAHLEFRGGARYDDELAVSTSADLPSPARLRFDVQICHHSTAKPVVQGYTIHAFTDATRKPIRPPDWFTALMGKASQNP